MTTAATETSTDGSAALRDHLIEQIRGRRLRAGHRLPTERELCDSFGLGRSAVRRVLTQLKDKGLIVQTVGSGTYVADDVDARLNGAADTAASPDASPAELIEGRILLEPMIVELVVRNATTADFVTLEECCDKAEAAQTQEQFEYWDGLLHQRIAAASHNRFIVSVYSLITKARENAEWGVLKKRSYSPERRAKYEKEHRDIVAALKDRDAETARAILMGHLIHVRKNMLGM